MEDKREIYRIILINHRFPFILHDFFLIQNFLYKSY